MGERAESANDYAPKPLQLREKLRSNIRRNTPNRNSGGKEALSVEGFNNVYGSVNRRMQKRIQIGSGGLYLEKLPYTKISAHALNSFGSATTSNAETNPGQISESVYLKIQKDPITIQNPK